MVPVLFAYGGWQTASFVAEEVREPRRNLPRALVLGVSGVVVLYLAVNWVSVEVLGPDGLAATTTPASAVMERAFGRAGARWIAVGIAVSTLGFLSQSILTAPRVYFAMARDGLFFRSLAAVHPRFRTPARSLWAQSAWAIVLTASGTYEQLYTYVVFAAVLFHVATGAAVFTLRRKRPDAPRPYRVWGYPWVPALFIAASLALVANTLWEKPVESLWGLGLVALGLPAYAWWRRGGAGAADGSQ
jgi:APA family basic amino acid/polyamine antiporter